MARAYVRICVNVGKERELRDEIRKYPEVKSAEITAGEQDLIALVEAGSFEEILSVVSNKIRKNPNIKVTWTNFILE
ncbi:MAG: Lrp/AsnC ligand binding domain-containing protein [Thermoanaerobaculia bacterium]